MLNRFAAFSLGLTVLLWGSSVVLACPDNAKLVNGFCVPK
ncbi:hypothetical protein SAMN03080610_02942 [Afifella marina DSM 2698]|uniref:Uncharacterized protein n=1 Tax=Afifella marina DSM 2698 TaxID=1120955 RepID=A0A1G5NZ23_AFIMA|nr:hypothetical protein SAMN03080610_02942 [Afifella marina DSM 2698]